MPQSENPIWLPSEILEMDKSAWRHWLDSVLENRAALPLLPNNTGQKLLDLTYLYHALPHDSAEHFGVAVAELLEFERTPLTQRDAERLLLLVDLANVSKPPQAKLLLRRYLDNSRLRDFRIDGIDLHLSILNAACAYVVDDDMVAFIQREGHPSSGLEYLLACFRLLSYSMRPRTTYSFLERVIPLLRSNEAQDHFKRTLRRVVRRLGTTELLRFCQLRRRVLNQFSHEYDRFKDVLLRAILPPLVRSVAALEADEPAAVLLQIQMDDDMVDIGLGTLKAIAEMADHDLPRELITPVLAALRSRQSILDPLGRVWDLSDGDAEQLDGSGEQSDPYQRPRSISIYCSGKGLMLDKEEDHQLVNVFLEAFQLWEDNNRDLDLLEKLAWLEDPVNTAEAPFDTLKRRAERTEIDEA